MNPTEPHWTESTGDAQPANATPSAQAERLLEQGSLQLEAGQYDEALASLGRAHALVPESARVQSLLGLATARSGGAFEEARVLCEEASKRDFDNPDLYVNLANVYLGVGRRSEALRYLRRGRMIDPSHAVIQRTLSDMGRRRRAVIRFLPRRHPINRVLGFVRGGVFDLFGMLWAPTFGARGGDRR
jgi:Flp pilus assembly protein TadD